jgi:hypothetical protein
MFGTVQPAVREATWYALIAYHWAAEAGLVNLVASIVIFRGAFRPVGLMPATHEIRGGPQRKGRKENSISLSPRLSRLFLCAPPHASVVKRFSMGLGKI